MKQPQTLAQEAQQRAIRREVKLQLGTTVYWFYPAQVATEITLIFVHGYRGNHLGLAAIAGALPNFNIISPDLPGFGESQPFEGQHSIANYATWLTQFVAEVGNSDTVIFAHSFGTIVAALAANQGLDNQLILVNPVSQFARNRTNTFLAKITDGFYWLGWALPKTAGVALLKNAVMVRFMSEFLAKTKDKNLRTWIHRQHAENFSDFASTRVAVEGYKASTSRSVSTYAPTITNKVLLIVGSLDDITPLQDQIRVLELFPNAQMEIIEGVGHLIHYETPAQAAALATKFITHG